MNTNRKVIIMVGILGAISGIFSNQDTQDSKYNVAEIYTDLRNKILTTEPSDIGNSFSESDLVWGILMEMGEPEDVATLVALADGTVSLYFSNGGGIIGIGQHEAPRKAGLAFISRANEFLEYAAPTKKFPLPKNGNVRFYFLTFKGILTAENNENELEEESLPLSPLFMEAHEVLTEMRIIDEQQKPKFQVLQNAAKTGDSEQVKMIINEGINPDNCDNNGVTPLMAAAYLGHDKVLKILLKQNCQIDRKDSSGYTALMFACNSGNLDCAQTLLDAGADVNAFDNEGSTPIMFAAQHGYNKLVAVLLEKGANPKIVGRHGLSAIGFARQNGFKKTEKILRGAK